jgi:protein phosphatase
MRIAVISDIHGNLPALEAVLRDIEERKADKLICLGDIIGKGPSSKEAVDICRSECDLVIKGNWDEYLFRDLTAVKQGREADVYKSMLWYINSVGYERVEYLGALPHKTELYLGGKLVRLFHAHPGNFNRYFDDSPIEKRLELFEPYDSEIDKRADIAVYADIHSVYMQMVKDGILINTGSVGNPLDIPEASYVMLEGDANAASGVNIQFVRIQYDIDKAIALAREAGVPHLDGYISELRTAVYFRRD